MAPTQRLRVVDHQSAGVFRITPSHGVQDVLMLVVGDRKLLGGEDWMIAETEQEEIGLLLVSQDKSSQRRVARRNAYPAVELPSGTQ